MRAQMENMSRDADKHREIEHASVNAPGTQGNAKFLRDCTPACLFRIIICLLYFSFRLNILLFNLKAVFLFLSKISLTLDYLKLS